MTKWEILESKTELKAKELEKELDSLVLLELRENDFCLRIKEIPEDSGENNREEIIKVLANLPSFLANSSWIGVREYIGRN